MADSFNVSNIYVNLNILVNSLLILFNNQKFLGFFNITITL